VPDQVIAVRDEAGTASNPDAVPECLADHVSMLLVQAGEQLILGSAEVDSIAAVLNICGAGRISIEQSRRPRLCHTCNAEASRFVYHAAQEVPLLIDGESLATMKGSGSKHELTEQALPLNVEREDEIVRHEPSVVV
jgi:hypothetical protein